MPSKRDFDPALMDGERIAVPWARVHMDSNQPRLEALSGERRILGVQGVHPVAAGTYPTPAEKIAAEEAMATLDRGSAAGPPTRVLQLTYCSWASGNGVIADAVRGRHAAFFRWLNCH